MKFQIGWTQNKKFKAHHVIKELSLRKEKIDSIYFAPSSPLIPSARNSGYNRHAEINLYNDLNEFSEEGFNLNILFNGLCYGGEIHSEKTFSLILDTIGFYREKFNITDATFIDCNHAIACRKNFPSIRRNASINMFIRDLSSYNSASKVFNVINIDRMVNYNIEFLKKCKEDNPGTELKLLVNEACINGCLLRALHFAHLSHSNGKFNGNCYKRYKNNSTGELLSSQMVMPQYLKFYEGFVDTIKISRRDRILSDAPEDYINVIKAYMDGDLSIPVIDLACCGGLYQYIAQEIKSESPLMKIKCKDIPEEHFFKKTTCIQNCYDCNYCFMLGNSLLRK